MIERNFIKQGIRNAEIEAYLRRELDHAEYSHSEIKRTPLNTRIMIYAGRPGMVIGRAGTNIQRVTETLEKRFGISKPQLEIVEIQNQDLDARVVAKKIAAALEKGNNARKVANIFVKKVLSAGAIGVEIVIAGKSGGGGRSRADKFLEGYLKKCGDTAERYADRAKLTANTKPGVVGIKVRIMRELPDEIKLKAAEVKTEEKPVETVQEAAKEAAAESVEAEAEAEERKEIEAGAIEPPVKPVPEEKAGEKKAEKPKEKKAKAEKKPRAKKEKAEKKEKGAEKKEEKK